MAFRGCLGVKGFRMAIKMVPTKSSHAGGSVLVCFLRVRR